MNGEEIIRKYTHAIATVTGDGTWIDWGVMRLALRLAVQDAVTVGQVVAGHEAAALRVQLEAVTAERNSLVATIESGITQLAQMDADNAQLRQERNQAEADLTRLEEYLERNGYATDTDCSAVTRACSMITHLHGQLEEARQELENAYQEQSHLERQLAIATALPAPVIQPTNGNAAPPHTSKAMKDFEITRNNTTLWVGESAPSLIDVILEFTLDTTDATELAYWLEAWLKTQQWQPEAHHD